MYIYEMTYIKSRCMSHWKEALFLIQSLGDPFLLQTTRKLIGPFLGGPSDMVDNYAMIEDPMSMKSAANGQELHLIFLIHPSVWSCRMGGFTGILASQSSCCCLS
jgi:hypothetical protein